MNKPRLIDANELMKILQNWYQSVKPKTPILKDGISQETPVMENISRFMRFVEEQPTAYDPDKVVEQLDELEIAEVYDYMEFKYFDYVDLYKAIEIVKGGADNGL